jgi:hypothetical protein
VWTVREVGAEQFGVPVTLFGRMQIKDRHVLQLGLGVAGQVGGPLVDLRNRCSVGVSKKHGVGSLLEECLVFVLGSSPGVLCLGDAVFVVGRFDFASEESGEEFDDGFLLAGEGTLAGVSGRKTDCAVHVAVDEDGRAKIAVESVLLVCGVVGPALLRGVGECDGALSIDNPSAVRRGAIECHTIGEIRVVSIAGDDGICCGIVVAALDVTMFDP